MTSTNNPTAWLVIGDGREEYLAAAIASGREHLDGNITERWLYDDTGDSQYRNHLAELYPDFRIIHHVRGRQGFAGAIDTAWFWIHNLSAADFIFHHEEDFTFDQRIDLGTQSALLLAQPHLAQLALRRQRWGAEPQGGFIAEHPELYTERTEGSHTWVETARNWTTNPCIYRTEIVDCGWPQGDSSEVQFGDNLRRFGLPWGVTGGDVRFGFVGSLTDGAEMTYHIGRSRSHDGRGY